MALAHLTKAKPKEGSALSALLAKLDQAAGGLPSSSPQSQELTFGRETAHQDSDFIPRAIERPSVEDLDHSGLQGLSAIAPEVDPLREGGGLAEFGDAGLGLSREHRLAPRHRRAVLEFFGTGESSGPANKPPAEKPPR